MTIPVPHWNTNTLAIIVCAMVAPAAFASSPSLEAPAKCAPIQSAVHGVLVYSRTVAANSSAGGSSAYSELFACRIPGGHPKLLLNTKSSHMPGTITSVAIQPTGANLAFIGDEPPAISNRRLRSAHSRTLWLLDFTRDRPAPIIFSGNAISCQWAPNGKSLAVLVHGKPMDHLCIVNLITGASSQTSIAGPGAWCWTFDSRAILFTDTEGRLSKQRPAAARPSMTWRLPESNMTPASSSVYPVLAAGAHSVVRFTSHGRQTVLRSSAQIISGEVFPAPGSSKMVFQTTLPESVVANGREDMPLSASRDIEIWSSGKKRLNIPMRWSDSPAFGQPSHHIAGWTWDGKNILMLHETLSPGQDLRPQVEVYLLNPTDTPRPTDSGKRKLRPRIFRSGEPIDDIDFREDR